MASVVLNDWVMETKVTPWRSKSLDQLEEIQQRAGKPVDLVDDHDVDLAGLDVGQEPLEGRALQRAAGEAAIVVAVGDLDPSFRLAG